MRGGTGYPEISSVVKYPLSSAGIDAEETDRFTDWSEEGLCVLVICRKPQREILLPFLGEGIGVHHNIQDRGRYRERIKVTIDLPFLRIIDPGIVDHHWNAVWFIVWILHRRAPISQERTPVISMTSISKILGGGVHDKESFVLQPSFSETEDQLFDYIIRPSHGINPRVQREVFSIPEETRVTLFLDIRAVILLHPCRRQNQRPMSR
jgi:hypothetical protein